MLKMIKCECGYTAQSEMEEKLVKETQKHAKDFDQMDLTNKQVLAMAQLVRK